MRVVGNAVEGAKDHWEELALLFAWSTQDQASEFTLARRHGVLRQRREPHRGAQRE